jgi:hypothetical protein
LQTLRHCYEEMVHGETDLLLQYGSSFYEPDKVRKGVG